MTKTSVISVKIDPKTKEEAQKAAKEIGIPLSTLIGAYLKDFARTKTVTFSTESEVRPEVGKILSQASKDYKNGINFDGPFETDDELQEYFDSLK